MLSIELMVNFTTFTISIHIFSALHPHAASEGLLSAAI